MSPVPPRFASAVRRPSFASRPSTVDARAARRGPRPWRLVALQAAVTAAVLGVPSAASAAPSKIAYGCGPEVCVVDPESGTTAAITTDGAASPYRHPSLSADGTRMAALRVQDVVVGPTGDLAEVWESSRSINDGDLVATEITFTRTDNKIWIIWII